MKIQNVFVYFNVVVNTCITVRFIALVHFTKDVNIEQLEEIWRSFTISLIFNTLRYVRMYAKYFYVVIVQFHVIIVSTVSSLKELSSN